MADILHSPCAVIIGLIIAYNASYAVGYAKIARLL